jgi:hypothetical protein
VNSLREKESFFCEPGRRRRDEVVKEYVLRKKFLFPRRDLGDEGEELAD